METIAQGIIAVTFVKFCWEYHSQAKKDGDLKQSVFAFFLPALLSALYLLIH